MLRLIARKSYVAYTYRPTVVRSSGRHFVDRLIGVVMQFTTTTTSSKDNDKDISNGAKLTDIEGSEEELTIIDREEELQPQWKALESRVNNRRTKKIGDGPQGRSPRRPSAWDHNVV